MPVQLRLPAWVQPVALRDVDAATQQLADVLAETQERGRVGRGELESAASQVVEQAMAEGIPLIALVRPPGQPAAMLSVLGVEVPAAVDRHMATRLISHLHDRGGPGVAASRFDAGQLGTAVLAHRVDASGAQAQAVLGDGDDAWYVLTLAAPQADRGPELLDVLREILAANAGSGDTSSPERHAADEIAGDAGDFEPASAGRRVQREHRHPRRRGVEHEHL